MNPAVETPYSGPERRVEGTVAVSNAAAMGSAAGTAAAKAMEYGSMGLSGWSRVVGNMSAMVVIVVLLFANRADTLSAQRESRQLMIESQAFTREEMRVQRQHDHEEREATRNEFRSAIAVLIAATSELRTTREAVERLNRKP